MNVSSVPHDACTGCAACVSACPVKALRMEADDEGFLYPAVDGQCTDCGLCYKKCPVNERIKKNEPLDAYAMQRSEREAARRSASGGAAALLAELVVQRGGAVYGCVMDREMQVRHIRVDTMEDVSQLRGSKYVQSDFSQVYAQLREDCESGRPTAVFATPCQIAGVRNYLGKEYDNLLLVDLICHGVPNQWLFDKYLEWKVERMGGGQMVAYTFRDKKDADWGTVYRATTVTTTTTTTGPSTFDPYYSAFIYAETYRRSCYQCQYATMERAGDITIGDYWGVQRAHPELVPICRDGMSAVLVNTEKGRAFAEDMKRSALMVPSTAEQIAQENGNLIRPAAYPAIRKDYYRQVHERGFRWANRAMLSQKRYYVALVKYKTPAGLKRAVKKVLRRSTS